MVVVAIPSLILFAVFPAMIHSLAIQAEEEVVVVVAAEVVAAVIHLHFSALAACGQGTIRSDYRAI